MSLWERCKHFSLILDEAPATNDFDAFQRNALFRRGMHRVFFKNEYVMVQINTNSEP